MLGESLALTCALTWAISVILFRRSEAVSAHSINLFKNVLATLFLGVTILFWHGAEAWRPDSEDTWRLIVSGLVALALGDTLSLLALRRLGAARLAIVECLYAPLIVTFSVLFLGESPPLFFFLGAASIVLGVILATTERNTGKDRNGITESPATLGAISLGVFGVLGWVSGILLVKSTLERGGLLEVTFYRLLAGVTGQLLITGLVPSLRPSVRVFVPSRVWWTLFPGAILGTYISMLLWMGGFKWTDASTAAILNQTSTVFIVLLAWFYLGEAMTPRRWIGCFVALLGVLLVLTT